MATTTNTLLQKSFSIIISVALTVSGWFLTQAYGELNKINSRVQSVELVQAKTEGNRFTSNDWQTNKTIIDQQMITTNQRVLILEENMKNIKELLAEIRADLKELKTK